MPGYGIVRLNKIHRTITFECWPRFADPDDPSTGGQYDDWPITIHQLDNDGRPPRGYLPALDVQGMVNPIVQIIDESNDEIVYTLRIKGTEFQPKVFRSALYTVRIGELDAGPERVFRHIQSTSSSQAGRIVVSFDGQ